MMIILWVKTYQFKRTWDGNGISVRYNALFCFVKIVMDVAMLAHIGVRTVFRHRGSLIALILFNIICR